VELDGLAAISDGDLVGMIDTDNVGLMGWALGANASLQLLGLLRDPIHYTAWCADHPDFPTWDCGAPPEKQYLLDEITAQRAQLGLQNLADGRWAPVSDERVRAVFAMAPGDFPLTSEDDLASVTTPTMILHGTRDGYHDYEGNAARTYTHLGTEDRYLISLSGGGHEFYDASLLKHFSTAFFGLYLQGNETYRLYLTAEQAATWHNVVWGVDERAITDPQYITEMTFTDVGTVAVGDTITGEVAERNTRIGYSLTLEADTTLNLYANSAPSVLDPVLYICNAQGDVLFWNDELSVDDDRNYSAGLEGIELPEGRYIIIVGDNSYRLGHYELIVESAE
jgi:hypothetical protein